MNVVVADCLERELALIGLMGVGANLQEDVKSMLELLRNAGIRS